MRGPVGKRGTLAALVVTLAGGPPAAAATVGGVHRTRAGDALARSALLTRTQFGHGWHGTAAPTRVAPLTCPAFDPPEPNAVEIGAAATGRFSTSSAGPFVSQSAYAYATAAQGEAVARAQLRRRLVVCVAGSLSGGSTRAVKFSVLRRHGLAVPSFGAGARGYRIAGTANQSGQTVDVYLDAIVLARGQLVTELSLASFFAPPPRKLELRLERRAAHRLAALAG